jgi:hypothetical protein
MICAELVLPARILANSGSKHLSHDHLGNLIRLDAGTRQQCSDNLGTQIHCCYLRDGAVEYTDGAAQRRRDDHIVMYASGESP